MLAWTGQEVESWHYHSIIQLDKIAICAVYKVQICHESVIACWCQWNTQEHICSTCILSIIIILSASPSSSSSMHLVANIASTWSSPTTSIWLFRTIQALTMFNNIVVCGSFSRLTLFRVCPNSWWLSPRQTSSGNDLNNAFFTLFEMHSFFLIQSLQKLYQINSSELLMSVMNKVGLQELCLSVCTQLNCLSRSLFPITLGAP